MSKHPRSVKEEEPEATTAEPELPLDPDRLTSINEPPGSNVVVGDLDPSGLPIPTPVVTGMTPDSATIGDEDFTLYVSGEGFVKNVSVIHFAGHDEPTTFNADGTLSTGVKPSLWAEPVDVPVGVRNGDRMSEFATFSFEAPATRSSRHHGRR